MAKSADDWKKWIEKAKEALDLPMVPLEEAEADVDAANKRLDHEKRRLGVSEKKQVLKFREKYSKKIFCLVAAWLAVMLIFVLLDGLGVDFDSGVMIALISGTTINVIGLLAIVAKYIFPGQGS